MRFAPDPDDADPDSLDTASLAYRQRLIAAIYEGVATTDLSEEKREALTIALVLEISEALYGHQAFETDDGELHVVLWLTSPVGVSENSAVFEEARLDLLFALVGIVDARLSECDILPPASAPAIARIVEGVARTWEGQGAPILAFSRRLDGAEAFSASNSPLAREDVLGLVEDYFDL